MFRDPAAGTDVFWFTSTLQAYRPKGIEGLEIRRTAGGTSTSRTCFSSVRKLFSNSAPESFRTKAAHARRQWDMYHGHIAYRALANLPYTLFGRFELLLARVLGILT